MLTAEVLLKQYSSFFTKRNHVQIPTSPLVLANDPTTLFTSSGMQPLVPYLLGEEHPQGKRLVNVQNCFRAQDIDEIGDNRHTTFFRMLGNWSLGDYFKDKQLPWMFEFLTNTEEGLGLDPHRLYVTVFAGNDQIPKDTESIEVWRDIFSSVGIEAKEGKRIFTYGAEKNWWSRSGTPDKMPAGEPGGPDSEVFFEFSDVQHDPKFGATCHVNCDCGRYIELCNSVFMQYIKKENGAFEPLPKQNVDYGGGLERMLLAVENNNDVFQTSLFHPIIKAIEHTTNQSYSNRSKEMRIITDHLIASSFIIADNVKPSNKEQGYILRRLIRRSLDNVYELQGASIEPIVETIVNQYKDTDPMLAEKFELIRNTILEEEQKYKRATTEAKRFIQKNYKHVGDELKGTTEISADDAFLLYTTHGLSPIQIKSLGYTFDDHVFAEKMKSHQNDSRKGATQKFKGGLADTHEKTIMGHTATHLLHQALRDVLGKTVHQTGSNITTERVRFDFNFDRPLTPEELKKVEDIVNEKIHSNLPVHFEIIETKKAHEIGAIGLFMDTYGDKSKIYFIGEGSADNPKGAYSIEFCGGPHVDFTQRLKSFKIQKQENLGQGQKRLYAIVDSSMNY